jgi:hypothetical protein
MGKIITTLAILISIKSYIPTNQLTLYNDTITHIQTALTAKRINNKQLYDSNSIEAREQLNYLIENMEK